LSLYQQATRATERWAGSPYATGAAVATVLVWAACGPIFHYSDTWQLVINTGTTVVTFLMVFLIQGTQSRDTKALHLKLDELVRANREARNIFLAIEDMSDDELDRARAAFKRLAPTA
jgi:low affinity Fe/Cu permease